MGYNTQLLKKIRVLHGLYKTKVDKDAVDYLDRTLLALEPELKREGKNRILYEALLIFGGEFAKSVSEDELEAQRIADRNGVVAYSIVKDKSGKIGIERLI